MDVANVKGVTVNEQENTENYKPKAPGAKCSICPYLTIGKYVPTQMPNGTPRIMVLGEAPGPQEAKTGIPFTGPSGNLLNKVLRHHGIDINEVIKSNVCLCLHREVQVSLPDGKSMSIYDIVKNKYSGDVLSEENGKLVNKKVIGWYASPLGNRYYLKVIHEDAKGNNWGKSGIVLTNDHEVLTQRGFVRADELEINKDKIATGLRDFNGNAEQLMLSAKLGDGQFKRNTEYQESHCDEQLGYMLLRRQLLSNYAPSPITYYGEANVYRLPAHRSIKYFVERSNIETVKRLNWFGFCLWYLDDGYIRPDKWYSEISITRMSEEEAQEIAKIITTNFAPCYVNMTKLGPRLIFNVSSTKIIANNIAKYVPKCLKYKLTPETRNTKFDDEAWASVTPNVLYSTITDVERYKSAYKTVYCIDVEDTHRFVTVGGVVHNCRPNGPTEAPPKAAIEACSERLHTEIAKSGVQFLVPVGNTAAHAVLNSKRTITSLRVGPPKTYKYDPSVKVIPTVHPAFCLRSPDNFPDFVADIGKINSVSYSGWEEPTYKVFDDPEIALQAIAILKERTKEVVIDIEAGIEKDIDFVQPEEYQMLCIGLCYEAKKAVVFGEEALKDQRVLDALNDYLSGVRIIGQNAKFDLRGLSPLLGIHKIYFDTMLASHALDERPGKHGLKDMAVEILGAPRYDDEIKKYIPKGGNYANIPRDILYKYNAYDVVCTWDLYKIFEQKMTAELRASHDFKVRGANALIHLELAGITFDVNYSIDLAYDYEQKIADIEEKFTELLGFEINPRSWQQIQKYFISDGIKLKSTDSDHIEELQKKLVNNRNVNPKVYQFTILLMEHRKLAKLLGTFVKGLLKRVNKGKIHTTYTLHGTTSGRLASKSPNLQNVRKINEIRNQFTVEHPDNTLIQLDYKQAELRVITTLAQDEYFREILADSSRDLFTELQKQIYGNKEVYDARRKIKSVVYGLCVPLDTKILTRRGWLTYDQVIPNVDETIGYDQEIGKSRWTKIKNVFTYKDQDIMKISNATTSFEATPNHRWLATKSTRKWINGKHSKRIYKEEFVETKNILQEHHLQLAKRFESDNKLDITDQEAAILGWAMSDGYIQISPRTGITGQGSNGELQATRIHICQNLENLKFVKEIDELLKNHKHTRDRATVEGQITWRIFQPIGRDLMRRAGLLTVSGNYKEVDPIKFVFSMSDSQRFAFIKAIYHGDGVKGQPIICQNSGWLTKVISLIGYLEGYVVRTVTNNHNKLSDKVQYRHRFGKSHITGQELKKEYIGKKDVWCVETALGTWTMQQNGLTVLTGNSYGREAQSIAVELNIPLSEAVELMANFKALIPQVVAWQNSVTHRVLNGKDLVTPFGRKRSFYLITEENKRDVVNEALSYLPQSIASDICLDALIHVQPMLEGIATLRLTVHDALVLEAHKSKAKEAIEIVQREMIASGQRFTNYVPFPVDVSTGQRLGEL